MLMKYQHILTSRTGSGSAEGFHNRLNHNMSLDKVVDYLASEDEYWRRLVNDPCLWTEEEEEDYARLVSGERHRRKHRMLKHYVERGNNPDRADTMDMRSISSDLLSSDGNNDSILGEE